MERKYCSGRVYDGRLGHNCCRSGSVLENGKYWCKQHAPSAVKKRREECDMRYRIRSREQAKIYFNRDKTRRLLEFCENNIENTKENGNWIIPSMVKFIEKIKTIIEEKL